MPSKLDLAGMNVANLIDLIPVDSKETPDWNAGFLAGFKEELAQTYPTARK